MLDKHGISVLLAAIWEGHTDCVKTLLKNVSNSEWALFCKISMHDLQFHSYGKELISCIKLMKLNNS